MGNKAKPHRRWTFDVPDTEVRPRGKIKFLKRAVEKLGPFQQCLKVDAKEHSRWVGLWNHIPLSEELAVENIERLVGDFNRQLYLENGAPRCKHIVDQLTELETRSGELARLIHSFHYQTCLLLRSAGTGIAALSLKDIPTSMLKAAKATDFPLLGRCDGKLSGLAAELEAASQYVNRVRANFLKLRQIDDVDAPDKGGNTNLYKEIYGCPRLNLVEGAWRIHEHFKPGVSTGTEGGPFHCFVMEVFEYATGLEQEPHSKLVRWVKHVAKVKRQARELTRCERTATDEQTDAVHRASTVSHEEQTEAFFSMVGKAITAIEAALIVA